MQATTQLLSMLDDLSHWVEDIPPLPTPQRFGNLAFRTWGRRLDTVCCVSVLAYFRMTGQLVGSG
jgi:hypothetical protein